ncbi:MAG TPA: PH domain-containing protein [Gaiellaceae bacterium]|nr:PH domain-containing protein [Gaiellaceae bacterium]
MEPSPVTFPAASLDLSARITTGLIWVLALGLAAGGAWALATAGTPAGPILLIVGGSLVALNLFLRRREPRAYAVDSGRLSISRRSASPVHYWGGLARVHRGALGWRVAGDGGGYGYLGRYRAEGRSVSAYVTDRAKVVLLEVGGDAIALSPADPEDFIEKITRGA